MSDDLFGGYGVEVRLLKDFNVIRESISRIGYAARDNRTLYQSCHIFHKRGRYAIMHFKELFAFDGKQNTITEGDIARRNTIIDLLVQWGLIEVINKPKNWPVVSMANIKVVKRAERDQWDLQQKYSIGSH